MRRIKVELRNLGLLTVGSAYPRLTLADINTVKINGKVLIPGSSFKGALRTAAHRVAPKIGLKSCGEVEPRKISKAHGEMGGKCDVCDLFGMPGAAATSSSRLLVTDLISHDKITTVTLTRVSIDPASWKAQEGGLFTVEAAPICTTFEGELILLDDEEKHLKLLLSALEELMNGTIGRGSIVEIRATEGIPDSMEGSFEQLRNWRWDICP